MRTIIVLALAFSLSACSIFGGKKTRLVPQAYMPEPPAILMKEPKKLHTIKKEPEAQQMKEQK
jgi:hypothetical protein